MNRAIALTILLPIIGCATDKQEISTTSNNPDYEEYKLPVPPFGMEFQLTKVDKDQYSFAATIQLDSGDFVVSPYSKDSIYGHIEISFNETLHINVGDTLIEIPSSVQEYDPILEEEVRFVRESTTYKRNLTIVQQDDFEVSGLVWFVLEPSCVPFQVEFIISKQAGEMSVIKTNTGTAYPG